MSLITTTVGPNILKRITPAIAKGLKEQHAANLGTLNIITCENMIGQMETLRKYIQSHLTDKENAWLSVHISFANCSVDHIIPALSSPHHKNPLNIGIEEFSK